MLPAHELIVIKAEEKSYLCSLFADVDGAETEDRHGGRDSREKLVASKSTVDPGGAASRNCKCRMYLIASLIKKKVVPIEYRKIL